MITNKKTGPSCDLWAFGLILYKMITGKSLFENIKEYVLYDVIKNGNFKIEEEMDFEIRDLICKLLVLRPEDRLGAGDFGSFNSFERLKEHEFFREKVKCEVSIESLKTCCERKRTVMKGIVARKRNFLFYDYFELVLFDDGVLSLFCLKNGNFKESFGVNREYVCKMESKNFFSVEKQGEKLSLKIVDKTRGDLWVKEINKFIL